MLLHPVLDPNKNGLQPMLKRCPWPVILQIIPELSTGGAERTTIEMAEAITLGGGLAVVLSEGGRLEDELAHVGGHLIRFPAGTKNPARIVMNALRIRGQISRLGVSLVHARSRAPGWSAYCATRMCKRAFVTTYHGIYNQKSALKAYYNSVMARGDVLICNSHYTANAVRARYPDAAGRVDVIYRGVDLDRFDPATVTHERVSTLRCKWGVSPNARIVLLPARMTRWKGHETLIEAASLLGSADAMRDVIFVLAGDDQGRSAYGDELAAHVRRLGLNDRFIFAGHCSDMPAAFAASEVTVIPSIEPEAFGRVSIEAQAMGCPVIASNIGALPETLSPLQPENLGRIGNGDTTRSTITDTTASVWLPEPGDAAALSNGLRSVLAMSKPALDAVRDQAKARVHQHFSKTMLQAKTLAVYDRLLGTQLAPTFQALIANR